MNPKCYLPALKSRLTRVLVQLMLYIRLARGQGILGQGGPFYSLWSWRGLLASLRGCNACVEWKQKDKTICSGVHSSYYFNKIKTDPLSSCPAHQLLKWHEECVIDQCCIQFHHIVVLVSGGVYTHLQLFSAVQKEVDETAEHCAHNPSSTEEWSESVQVPWMSGGVCPLWRAGYRCHV